MSVIVIRNDERLDVRDEGVLIGYVDEYDVLYGINNSGYAERIGDVSHRSEIVGKLIDWQKQQQKEMDICAHKTKIVFKFVVWA